MNYPVALVIAAAVGCTSGGGPGTAPPAPQQVAVAESSQTVKQTPSFSVRVIGSGPPMILLPGLACSDDVWREAVAHYASRYELHLITLAGFAGTPAIEAPFLATVSSDIVAYIGKKGLVRPTIMGHSLGAFLAFSIASAAPDKVGPIIALEGVPFGAALVNASATAHQTIPRAASLRQRVASVAPHAVESQARMMFEPMFTRKADFQRVLRDVVKSTPAAVGQAMYELMTTDLRPRVSAIKTPVLLIVSSENAGEGADRDLTLYKAQLTGIANHKVVVAEHTRHFVMVDAPQVVYGHVDRFLAANAR